MNLEKICKNCEASLKEEALFCASCGQKYRIGKPTLWSILGEFFSSLFNLDSEIYRSVLALFIPGKLTTAFLNGRIKSYAPPIRVFIVSSIFFIAALSFLLGKQEDKISDEAHFQQLQRRAFVNEIEGLKKDIAFQFPDSSNTVRVLDTLQVQLQPLSKKKGSYNDSISVMQAFSGEEGWGMNSDKQIGVHDIFSLPEEELFKKYQIEGVFWQLVTRQQIKSMRGQQQFFSHFIGQITMVALLIMPIVALLLKLLYFRRKHYFIDHFVFSLHYHSFGFVIAGILFLCANLWKINSYSISMMGNIILILVSIYLFIAMKWVYQQGWIKTFVKFLLLNFSYLFVFSFFVLIAMFVSFLVF